MSWVLVDIALVVLVLVVLYLGALYLVTRRRARLEVVDAMPPKAPTIRAGNSGAPPADDAEYRALLVMVLGDRGKAERLIAYEAEKTPGAGRPQLIEKAIERLRDDRQRYG